jgi:hypothetical protein
MLQVLEVRLQREHQLDKTEPTKMATVVAQAVEVEVTMAATAGRPRAETLAVKPEHMEVAIVFPVQYKILDRKHLQARGFSTIQHTEAVAVIGRKMEPLVMEPLSLH